MEQLAGGGAVVAQVSLGIALAASAGLRAFLPPLVVGLAARSGWVTLPEGFAWLASTPSLIVFGVACAVEIAGDKIPIVDHLLDAVATVVKPVAGAFVMLTVVADWSPLYLAVVWIICGGSLAAAVHAARANLRLLSTATTGGIANPVLSVTEDLGAISTVTVAFVFPVLAAVLVLAALVGLVVLALRLGRPRRAT
jgi:hypothetical protein